MVDEYYQTLMIEDERNTINFYAQEIGFFVDLKKKVEKENLKQWCDYFISYAEQELENANERLKGYRGELTDYQCRQRTVHPV